jgi:hypothetical protein
MCSPLELFSCGEGLLRDESGYTCRKLPSRVQFLKEVNSQVYIIQYSPFTVMNSALTELSVFRVCFDLSAGGSKSRNATFSVPFTFIVLGRYLAHNSWTEQCVPVRRLGVVFYRSLPQSVIVIIFLVVVNFNWSTL